MTAFTVSQRPFAVSLKPSVTFVIGILIGLAVAAIPAEFFAAWMAIFSTHGYGVIDWKVGVPG